MLLIGTNNRQSHTVNTIYCYAINITTAYSENHT